MFRANIYSIEPLTPLARDSVHDGIGMIAAYMGQKVISNEFQVRLPVNPNGYVEPEKVGFGKLDKLIELHIMAVPLEPGESERLGVAGPGRGWSFVDTSNNHSQIIRTTTSHESAHAFGFVTSDSKQLDPNSPGHCSDLDCLMHKSSLFSIIEPEPEPAPSRMQKLLKVVKGHRNDEITEAEILVVKQYDFCKHCKIDLHNNGEKQLNNLRHNRILKNLKIR